MPSLVSAPFPPLIRAIPVPLHSVEVEADPWKPKFDAAGQPHLWSAIFGTLPRIRLSRGRLHSFPYASPEQKCAEVLLWGYPADMRGIVSRLLPNLTTLSRCASTSKPWPAYYSSFPTGIGISSITKLAHFHAISFVGLRALILDERLIANTARWKEVTIPGLAYGNAHKMYLRYLTAMHGAATNPALACGPEQLELFLFALGANL
jgi:hypothetical protein